MTWMSLWACVLAAPGTHSVLVFGTSGVLNAMFLYHRRRRAGEEAFFRLLTLLDRMHALFTPLSPTLKAG